MFNRFIVAAAMSALLSACGGGSSDKPLSDTQKNFEASALGSTYAEFDWELPSANTAPVTGSNFFLASTYSVAASPSSGAIAYTRATLNLTQSMALPDASSRYVARALLGGKIYVLNNAAKSVVSYSGNDVVVTDYASDGVTPVFSSVFDLWSEPVILSGITLNDAALRSFYGFARLNAPLNFDYTKTWLTGAAYVKRKTYTADDRLYVYDWSGNSVDANVVAYSGSETKIEDYFASARIAAAGGESLDGVLYNIGDGTIATRQGARVWVANAKRPASVRPTDEYFSIIELNGKIYWGGTLKAGTRFKSADGVTPSLINDYTIRLNSQAVNSVKATVKF